MYQQLWGYKVENKLYLGVREQKRLNTTELDYATCSRVSYSTVYNWICVCVCVCVCVLSMTLHVLINYVTWQNVLFYKCCCY
jgi:hypothetical protein